MEMKNVEKRFEQKCFSIPSHNNSTQDIHIFNALYNITNKQVFFFCKKWAGLMIKKVPTKMVPISLT